MEPWEVSIVGSSSEPRVHLVQDRILNAGAEPRTLCGAIASAPAQTSFERHGCRRCCKAALKAGLTTVIDVNGNVLQVRTLLDTI